jgi:peptide/nickel transport system ATP-binding protein
VRKKHIVLDGEIPSPVDLPDGCPFHTRCHRKIGAICEREAPPLREFEPGHTILCHIAPEELTAIDPVFALGEVEREAAE